MRKQVMRLFGMTVVGGLSGLVLSLGLSGCGEGTAAEQSRGEYLVESVALCADCHSPRNERGEIILAQHLQGNVLPFAPTIPIPVWAPVAPPIAGLPTYSEDELVRLLTSGVGRLGQAPRPPMPRFAFSAEDARAAAAYLKSLKPAP